jgi:hypothetical protein
MARLNGHGKGKWHSGQALRDYKAKTKRKRQIAARSRKRNR